MYWVLDAAAAILAGSVTAMAARCVCRSRGALDSAYLQFIETLAQVLDARDPYTAGHSLRVAEYAHAIALQMGISEEEASQIRIAAQLHDIGKIGLPDAVLQKPGKLSPQEFGLIKLHPQIGRRILEKVGKFAHLLEVVELHHENHDGSGYPYRLAGERIPRAVRIVHVADAFDAMTTNRSYRSALSHAQAVEELRRNSGTQFNPEVVQAFLRLGRFAVSEPLSVMHEEPQTQDVA
jgi:HD-GYP domain-containing protein (c-di-GMP phosphodiesterase class II)